MNRAQFFLQFVNKQDLESSRLAFKRDVVATRVKKDGQILELEFSDGTKFDMPIKEWEWVRGW